MNDIHIALIDDHSLFRTGLKSIIEDNQQFKVCIETANAHELLNYIANNKVDIVITDITMPEIDGIELIDMIKNKNNDVKIIVISMHMNNNYIQDSIAKGAYSYLPKDTKKDELYDAINSVYNGKQYLPQSIYNLLINNIIINKRKKETSISCLTKRELEVLKLVCAGKTNGEIADSLFISIKTVDAHKNHILNKLELKSIVELVKFAIKNNIYTI